MKKYLKIGVSLLACCAMLTACSPYRVHRHAPPRVAHKAAKVPVTFLNHSNRVGCGCH